MSNNIQINKPNVRIHSNRLQLHCHIIYGIITIKDYVQVLRIYHTGKPSYSVFRGLECGGFKGQYIQECKKTTT